MASTLAEARPVLEELLHLKDDLVVDEAEEDCHNHPLKVDERVSCYKESNTTIHLSDLESDGEGGVDLDGNPYLGLLRVGLESGQDVVQAEQRHQDS